ncbi:MAG TPA: GTPase HflX [Acidobacteriaceae bacterium]
MLVSVEFSSRRRASSRAAAAARAAAQPATIADLRSEGINGNSPDGDSAQADRIRAPAFAVGSGFDFESSREEFRELVVSAGGDVVVELTQRRPEADPATLIGKGKIVEVAGAAASAQADVVLFDRDLSPTQLRNLENELPARVVDRTQLILDIFARHARTREGYLQVELAQLEYMLPRLAGRGAAMSQLGGGIGTRGPGETKLETDRRRIQRRLVQLRSDLDAVRRVRGQQRQRREAVPVPTIALVGYTNAGKSTLFNRLTNADVLESARMFATLDPKLKALTLPSRRKILLSDTVGFIRDLPHTLVTSFRATLEEVQKAEVLIHVEDASSPMRDERRREVDRVLAELDVRETKQIQVLNKSDLLTEEERAGLAGRSDVVLLSAKTGEGIEELLTRMDGALSADPLETRAMTVPQSEGGVLAALGAGARISEQQFAGSDVMLVVEGPASLLGRYRRFWTEDGAGRTGGRACGA